MKTIIVDDERKARENLSILLLELSINIEIIGYAADIFEAKKLIELYKPELLFLDIEMPGGNGFQLLENVSYKDFQVVFVTAYEDFAIKAFEVSAIDYLLKPIEISRLNQCISKVRENVNKTQLLETLKNTLDNQFINQLSIPNNSGYNVVNVLNILFFKAEEAYTKICVKVNNSTTEYIYARHLNYFENLFEEQDTFYRTHRSWMVNVKAIHRFDKINNIVVIDKFEIPISRRRMKEFQLLFQ